MTPEDELLGEQIAYYRARAPEYDDWFYRRNRHDRGEDHRRRWFSEVDEVRVALEEACPTGTVLELAAGTGIWTELLAATASKVVAIDSSVEALKINRTRVASRSVHYVAADIFGWEETAQFDFVFFGFWLSHVPPGRFEMFWEKVQRSLRPECRAFFVDNAAHSEYLPVDQRRRDVAEWVARRDLKDGREFDIVKVFYDPEELSNQLEQLGWRPRVRSTRQFLIYGEAVAQ